MLLFGKQYKFKNLNSMFFIPYPERDVHIGELEGPVDGLPKCAEFQARAHWESGEWEPRKGLGHFLEHKLLIRGPPGNRMKI